MDLEKVMAHLNNMRSWPIGWNGYDALPPEGSSIDLAISWVTKIAQAFPQMIKPTFVTGDGESKVSFEWREGAQSLEVLIGGEITYIAAIQMKNSIELSLREKWSLRMKNYQARSFAMVALRVFHSESLLIQSMLGRRSR